MNSVLIAQTPASVATGIAMLISHTIYESKTLVVVEGVDDQKLFLKFFNRYFTDIFPLGGCDKMDYLCHNLNTRYVDRFIVIKDSDFDNILGNEYEYYNLFRTDTHDLETMMMTETFYHNFSSEFLDGDEMMMSKIHTVEDEILPLSWLKLTCKANRKSIDFFSSCHCFYDGSQEVNITDCLTTLARKPENVSIGIPSELDVERIKLSYHIPDNKQLNNGHDLCSGYAYKYKVLTNKQISIDGIELMLRASYTINMFEETRLFSDIMVWSKTNNRTIF